MIPGTRPLVLRGTPIPHLPAFRTDPWREDKAGAQLCDSAERQVSAPGRQPLSTGPCPTWEAAEMMAECLVIHESPTAFL